jgi:hypothetical protein
MTNLWFEGEEHELFILTRKEAILICQILETSKHPQAEACKVHLLFQFPKSGEWKK